LGYSSRPQRYHKGKYGGGAIAVPRFLEMEGRDSDVLASFSWRNGPDVTNVRNGPAQIDGRRRRTEYE